MIGDQFAYTEGSVRDYQYGEYRAKFADGEFPEYGVSVDNFADEYSSGGGTHFGDSAGFWVRRQDSKDGKKSLIIEIQSDRFQDKSGVLDDWIKNNFFNYQKKKYFNRLTDEALNEAAVKGFDSVSFPSIESVAITETFIEHGNLKKGGESQGEKEWKQMRKAEGGREVVYHGDKYIKLKEIGDGYTGMEVMLVSPENYAYYKKEAARDKGYVSGGDKHEELNKQEGDLVFYKLSLKLTPAGKPGEEVQMNLVADYNFTKGEHQPVEMDKIFTDEFQNRAKKLMMDYWEKKEKVESWEKKVSPQEFVDDRVKDAIQGINGKLVNQPPFYITDSDVEKIAVADAYYSNIHRVYGGFFDFEAISPPIVIVNKPKTVESMDAYMADPRNKRQATVLKNYREQWNRLVRLYPEAKEVEVNGVSFLEIPTKVVREPERIMAVGEPTPAPEVKAFRAVGGEWMVLGDTAQWDGEIEAAGGKRNRFGEWSFKTDPREKLSFLRGDDAFARAGEADETALRERVQRVFENSAKAYGMKTSGLRWAFLEDEKGEFGGARSGEPQAGALYSFSRNLIMISRKVAESGELPAYMAHEMAHAVSPYLGAEFIARLRRMMENPNSALAKELKQLEGEIEFSVMSSMQYDLSPAGREQFRRDVAEDPTKRKVAEHSRMAEALAYVIQEHTSGRRKSDLARKGDSVPAPDMGWIEADARRTADGGRGLSADDIGLGDGQGEGERVSGRIAECQRAAAGNADSAPGRNGRLDGNGAQTHKRGNPVAAAGVGLSGRGIRDGGFKGRGAHRRTGGNPPRLSRPEGAGDTLSCADRRRRWRRIFLVRHFGGTDRARLSAGRERASAGGFGYPAAGFGGGGGWGGAI